MQNLSRPSRGIVLALLLTFVVQFAACGETQIDRAAKASNTVAQFTGEAIAIVKTLFETHAINLETKDKLADALLKFSQGGKEFNDLVKSVHDQFKSGPIPAGTWAQITAKFSELSKVFLQIVDLIPQASGLGNSKAFKTITAAILAVAQVLMQTAGIPRTTQLTARNAYDAINARIARYGISLVGVEI